MINEQIRDKEVRVVSETGEQLGIMSSKDAQKLADEQGVDLIKIAPTAKPPVCKIMDYGKFRYEQTRREKEAKKKQRVIEIKEVRLSPNIDNNDLNTKANMARKFLTKGDKVKVTLRFRGRELAHVDNGKAILNSFAEMLCEQPDDSVRIRIIEGYLIRLLTQSIQVDRQIIYATSFIKQSYGQLPVQNLIDKICICQRHFQRKFKDATGYTPKEFSRIIKFQYAIEVLRNAPHTDLSSIALDCGYYDHSHFIKEFKRLAGDVPSYFLTLPNPADEPLTYI